MVAAGLVAAAAGTPVVVHSGDRIPTEHGYTYRHVLDELGVSTDLGPEESAAMVDETGFGFYYQPRYNPGVHALLDSRDALGVRTFVNTIETLANPANARIHLGSFFHLSFARRIAGALERSETQAVHRLVLFRGLEGYDDIRPGHSTVAEMTDGDLEDYRLDTADYGLDADRDALAIGGPDGAAASARVTEGVLGDGVDRAYRVIDDGLAADRLRSIREFG